MMAGVIFLIFGSAGIASGGLLFVNYLENNNIVISGTIFIISLLMVMWGVFSLLIPKEYTYTKLKVYKIENVDMVVYENYHTNLNEKFCRSFNDGDSVYLQEIVPGWYGGMYYKEYRKILLEKPE